jgi:ribulose-phosphate 3-epimerase
MKKKILPSILSANFANLKTDINEVLKAGIDTLHIDVMDGHFVPNISIGPPVLKSLKKEFSDIFYDVHLMIENPQKYIKPFSDSGADLLNIHIETGDKQYITQTLSEIKKLGLQAGITCNPDTPIEKLAPFFEYIDLILIMTVYPGFGGQSFIKSASKKVQFLSEKKAKKNYKYIIEIDGGINKITIDEANKLGAEWFVIGSAIFEKDNIKDETNYYQNKIGV